MRYPTLLAAVALLAPAPLAAQALTPAETQKIDALVTRTLADTGVPSASIAVVRGGKIVLAKAYGKQFEGQRGPADPALPYQIASVSKQFTATAIQLLADEGKLSLDDTVAKYIPGISGGDTITIRQLLSHTSGLRDYWPQDYSFKAMATPTTPQGIVDRWAKAPLDFAPSTQWQYSNTGYVVAGLIVEKVSGQPLLDFLQARVFRPLGIRAVDQDKAVGPGFPQGYLRHALGPVRVETPAAPGWLYAAGELSMAPRDLAKWDVARMNRTLLPAKDWAEQETPVKLADGSNTNYGLGVAVGTADGRRVVEHSGEAVGFLTENIVYPDDKAAVVVAVNAWFADAQGRIAKGISDIVLPAPKADAGDAAALDRIRRVYAQLQAGRLDRSLLTEDAAYYFTPATIADYRSSLSPLGAPKTIEQTGKTRLRGGFVNRSYRVTYPNRTLRISTYAEPGATGKIEQFLVSPAE
ncbi:MULTISPECIES: serine hydrolase domain-containing protein [unclassified Sphingomonas]|uniref:serine hydrolase domain-containing protein n=1 Tax=unclassified Sphingomonas TaxID=196159 RepID=UPI002858782D|nr:MULTISPECIES: serine hydrolase domain-containing protein [unclassified Sphingomonas]MDR6115479.1 D-alanyl-D-alanine carboxypeptidase [Sphingomonas sp. SORGH_AS_0789]MDR6150850.1 D-alanyl-D-alanine carboxypeptidase [Sphingomonas sp. SORGH_AS_0742]